MARNKAKDIPKMYTSKIGFNDIAGHKLVKERLKFIINLLKNPKKLERFDTPPP